MYGPMRSREINDEAISSSPHPRYRARAVACGFELVTLWLVTYCGLISKSRHDDLLHYSQTHSCFIVGLLAAAVSSGALLPLLRTHLE
jgi:hypothetical protein